MDDLLAEVRRLFARMTDYLWLAVALNAFIFGWGPLISHDLIFWSLLLHIPIEVVSTRIYGQTIGKKLFDLKVLSRDQTSPSWTQSAQRALAVWLMGVGAGVIHIASLVQFISVPYLIATRKTVWDALSDTRVVRNG